MPQLFVFQTPILAPKTLTIYKTRFPCLKYNYHNSLLIRILQYKIKIIIRHFYSNNNKKIWNIQNKYIIFAMQS